MNSFSKPVVCCADGVQYIPACDLRSETRPALSAIAWPSFSSNPAPDQSSQEVSRQRG